MEVQNYTNLLPVTPPEGLLPWVIDKGHLDKELLIYKLNTNGETVHLCCTACQDTGTAIRIKIAVQAGCHAGRMSPGAMPIFAHPETGEDIYENGICLCPFCESPVTVAYGSKLTENNNYIEALPITVSRLENKLVLTKWLAQKHFRKDGTTWHSTHPYEAYVIEDKRIIRLKAHQNCMGRGTHLLNGWMQLKQYTDQLGIDALIYPWDKNILTGSTVENSKLDIFMNENRKNDTYPISYLRLWQKHPNVENLVMQGASCLLAKGIEEERNFQTSYYDTKPKNVKLPWVRWKQSRPSAMLGMNKNEFKACLRDGWTPLDVKFWQDEKKAGRILSVEDMKLVLELGAIRCIEIKNTTDLDYIKVARYLQKQKTIDKRSDLHILQDYWRMARENGTNLTLPNVRLPYRLMDAHDRANALRLQREKAKRDEKLKAEMDARRHLFEERHTALSIFAWSQNGILIRPVLDEEELRDEGDALDHCVGDYSDAHATGNKSIFLIRCTEQPDKPWYTLELDTKTLKVVQNRGKSNRKRTKEVQEFEDAWLRWCREEAEKRAREEKAAKPRPKSTPRRKRAKQRAAMPA